MYNMSILRHRFSNEGWGGGGLVLSYSVKVCIIMCVFQENLKGLTINLVLSLLKKRSRVQTFCFFVERHSMDGSYLLWNKFQDYQARYIF